MTITSTNMTVHRKYRFCLYNNSNSNSYLCKCVNCAKHLLLCNSLVIYLVVICMLLCGLPANAFNVDTITPLVQRGPSGTHFGFSVSQHKDRGKSWLLVGAPLAHTDQPGVERGGAVYKCNVDSSDSCQQIAFDRSGSAQILLNNANKQADDKSHQWFGATVHSGGENGMIVACAPRYVYYSTSLKRRDPVGTCWISRGSFQGFFEYSPCRTPYAWGYHRQGSCQAGFSASVSKDGKRLYIGGPGSWYWQGQAFSQDLQDNQTLYSTKDSPAYDDDSYLGYSTTIGEFTGDSDYDLAIGMPKGSNLTGKVILYTSSLKNIYNITGDQMGAYFGYSLTAADLNGDGYDDVVIGAPLYSSPNVKDLSYEKGRIYIAYQNREHRFIIKEDDHIDGIKSKARFGMSLASLSDINKDGYDDIAVGAPYDGEKGTGAVYIYLGSRKGLQPKYSQVIYADSIYEPGLKTFGFSLAGGLDLDNNQYPDLLVGAYASDRAIFLKSRPVVNVTASLSLAKDSISLDDRDCILPSDNSRVACLSIKLCLKYDGLGVDNQLDFTYETKLDAASRRAPRIFFLHKERESEERITVQLSKGSNYCTSRQAYLASNLRDKLTPIKVNVEYSLHQMPMERTLKPVLNQAISSVLTRQINIRKNCGKDNVCVPNLILNVKPSSDEYIVGSRKKIELQISVVNKGEDAFESMLYLFMPTDVNYVNINKTKNSDVSCYGAQPDRTGINNLECDIGNPLPAGRKIEFTIIMEPSKQISATSPDYTFIVEVNSTNSEKDIDTDDNNIAVGIPLRVEVNLTIYGISDPDVLSFNVSTETFVSPKQVLEDIGREISHSYTIQNRGPSTIKKADITILWPTRDLKGNYLLYLVDQPIVRSKPGKGFCKSITLDDLNPLGLRSRKVPEGRLPFDSLPSVQNPNTRYLTQPNNDNSRDLISSRHIRDTQTSNRPAIYGSKKHRTDPQTIEQAKSCGAVNCTRIICTVYELDTNDTVLFTIRSRFWKDNIQFINLEDFQISSKLVALVTALPYDVDPILLEPYVQTVTTKIYVTGLDRTEPIPLWIIILAIVVGLIILGGLALALWKLGFFKRKRPPSDLADREPLQSRNGYHYRKGDTSL